MIKLLKILGSASDWLKRENFEDEEILFFLLGVSMGLFFWCLSSGLL